MTTGNIDFEFVPIGELKIGISDTVQPKVHKGMIVAHQNRDTIPQICWYLVIQ